MNEFINLAEQSGMSRQKGEAVAAGLFAILQEEMDPHQYRQIASRVPEFDSLAQRHREENGSTDRGLGSSILSMITKHNQQGNNGGMEYLINTLKKHKVTIAELIIFIPLALWLLKREFGIDVFHLFGESKPTGTTATKPNNGGMFGATNNGKSDVGSPSSSLAGTGTYYNQLFATSNGDGRSAAPPTVVVPSYDVASPNSTYAPSYPVAPQPPNVYNPYGSNTASGNAYAASSFPVPSNNQYQYNPSGNGVYVPNYPAANNDQYRDSDPYQQQTAGSVYVPNYNQAAPNNHVYRPPNAGYNQF